MKDYPPLDSGNTSSSNSSSAEASASSSQRQPHRHRRRSWFQSTGLGSLLTGRPPPPQERMHRMHSDDTALRRTQSHHDAGCNRPAPGLVSLIKATTRQGLRRLPTSTDLNTINEYKGKPSFLHFKRKRSSKKKKEQEEPVPVETSTEPSYFLTASEEEADRIQLKNDLVKLAFEGYENNIYNIKEKEKEKEKRETNTNTNTQLTHALFIVNLHYR